MIGETLSLDVHQHVTSLIARVWKALRRSGAKLAPLTYGSAWVLVEARTGQRILEVSPQTRERLTLEAAGIRPSMVLLVRAPTAR